MTKRLLCLPAIIALACASSNNGLYPVTGMVTYKGQPAAGATVFFHRQGGDPLSEHLIMGIVQDDGSFSLVCGHQGKGAPPGEYDVLIEWKKGPNRGKGRIRSMPDSLNGRYADPHRPILHASLKAEANRLPPFELTN